MINALPRQRPEEDSAPPRLSEGRTAQDPVTEQLREEIARLSFGALAQIVRRLLIQMGYTQVQIKRTKQKGHNSDGGWDMDAAWEMELSRQKLIAQIKHYAYPVQMRSVDELRGALARAGAQQGLLITTGTFTLGARQAGQAAAGPDTTGEGGIMLVDGARLIKLLYEHRVGLREEGRGHWQVDHDLFDRLRRESLPSQRLPQKHAPQKQVPQTAPADVAAPPFPHLCPQSPRLTRRHTRPPVPTGMDGFAPGTPRPLGSPRLPVNRSVRVVIIVT